MKENQIVTLIQTLTNLLAPWLEVSVYAQNDQRQLHHWQPLGLAKLDNAFPTRLDEDAYIETLSNGKKVKTMSISSHDKTLGAIVIRMRFDMTWFAAGFEQMKQFMSCVQTLAEPNTKDWEETIEQHIQHYLRSKSLSLESVTRLGKRELILALYEKGLLNYKDSTTWLANRLHLSRATVYNHLNWAKSIRKIHIHQVDAFSDAPFGGNPAGVVLDADELNEDTMRSLTREMNNAETAFVLSSSHADLKMRYFTPSGHEMAFCGHSTVGALYMLAKEQRLMMQGPGHYQFTVETLAGKLLMGCDIEEEDISVRFCSPAIKIESSHHTHSVIAELLGMPLSVVNTKHSLFFERTNKDLYITVNDLKALESIECDTKAVAKFCKNHDINVICVLTPHTFSEKNHIHMRCFAPAVGINEDLFTGSVIGGLIAYAHKNKILKKEKGEIGIEQGHFLGRPGMVRVKYMCNQDLYETEVFAKANHFFSTEIQLNKGV